MIGKKELLDWVNTNSHFAKRRGENIVKLAMNILNDPDEDLRKKEQLCVLCYYQEGRIAGQAFTDSNCYACNKEMTFSNTDTDKLCPDCANENKLCQHCGVDINLKQRKKL